MKNITKSLLGLFAMIIVSSSCSKSDDNYFDANKQHEIDAVAIKSYVATNAPNAIIDSATGIWYEVLAEGDGVYQYSLRDTISYGQTVKYSPATVTVNYSGKLLNGTVFDKNDSATGMTGKIVNFIAAWYITFLPSKIGEEKTSGFTAKGLTKGSKIRIITPSYWGYGNYPSASIPANSPLDFTISVLDIK